ncbi:uncharacterized protein [Acropora muricata]|uniref:uncharacterized protein n=1 Tax=Acropora muricata TaxID=159855 RepID=UPI0034E602C2
MDPSKPLHDLQDAVEKFQDEAQERVADKVHGLADVVDDVIPDPDELAKQIRKIVMEVINGDDIKNAATQLSKQALKDVATVQAIADMAKTTLLDLLSNDETRQNLLKYTKSLIIDKGTIDAFKVLMEAIIRAQEVQQFLAEAVKEILALPIVKESAAELSKFVVSQWFMFLWITIKETLIPSWLRKNPWSLKGDDRN